MVAISDRGYMGQLLRIDLTKGWIKEDPLIEADLKKFIGGSGLGISYLYREVPPNVKWSDPENRFIIMSGPLGATVGGTGGYSVITKGPLTNGASSSQGMGFWGAFLKLAGYDGLVIQGAAKEWGYLYIHDRLAEIRDAKHLLGKNTWETQESIEQELGKDRKQLSVISIGPAGENLVRFACLLSDRGHVASKNGVGAVMGSKKLKAIAVERGQSTVHVNDRKILVQLYKDIMEQRKKQPGWEGTPVIFHPMGALGLLPVKNYSASDWEEYEKLDPSYYRKHFPRKREPCWACPLNHCHRIEISEGPHKGFVGEEPEFEDFVACGPVIGNKDPAAAIVLTNELDWLGLDANEAGWLIGWVMECYEEGLFTRKDTDGIEMTWGNVESTRQMLRKIAYREGCGDLLAEGVMRAALKIGGEANKRAVYTKKGNTPRGHDHRTAWNFLLDTAISSIGTDEMATLLPNPESLGLPMGTNRCTPKGAAVYNAAAAQMGVKHLMDSMLLCHVAAYCLNVNVGPVWDLLNAATGWTKDDVGQFGLRLNNLFRAFGIRHGNTAELEEPSQRYGSIALAGEGKGKSILPAWNEARQTYYEAMGWDRDTGKPLPQTLRKLGLDFVIPDLWP